MAVATTPPAASCTQFEAGLLLVQSRRGELRPVVPLPGGYLGYSQPGRSLVMFSAPKGPKYVSTLVRQAAADTTLYAGSKQVVCVWLASNLG